MTEDTGMTQLQRAFANPPWTLPAACEYVVSTKVGRLFATEPARREPRKCSASETGEHVRPPE